MSAWSREAATVGAGFALWAIASPAPIVVASLLPAFSLRPDSVDILPVTQFCGRLPVFCFPWTLRRRAMSVLEERQHEPHGAFTIPPNGLPTIG